MQHRKKVHLTPKGESRSAALALFNYSIRPDGMKWTREEAVHAVSHCGDSYILALANGNEIMNLETEFRVSSTLKEEAENSPDDIAEATKKNIEFKFSKPASSNKKKLSGGDVDAHSASDGILERAMAAALGAQVRHVFDQLQPAIREIVVDEIRQNFVKTISVQINEGEFKDVGAQHKNFPDLLRLCLIHTPDGNRLNVWIVGPAGTGKTTACKNVSKAINARRFGCIGTSDNKYELSGFVDAHGKVVNTIFKDIFSNGGVMLLDEIDSWYPNALLALQSALANNFCAFPDGVIERHKDCVVICAANTYGQGEVTEYVGRMKQDAAFLDRFVFLHWPIDEKLERHLAPNSAWVDRVQYVRRMAAEKKVRVLITPRASIFGSAMLEAGMKWEEVETMVLRKSMTVEQWRSVQ